jgi:hypothetical protein
MINEETGIDSHNVSRVRALLITYGLIGYNGRTVLIDWVRLCAFAAINARLMGQKQRWNITPIHPELLDAIKNDVHTYIGTGDQYSKYLYRLYEATAEAVKDGVMFPELRGTDTDELLGNIKNDVHTYIGIDNLVFGANGPELMGWYNPFDEPDPDWAADMLANDALPF